MNIYMYKDFSLVALYEHESKNPFIETMWHNGYIPCCYSTDRRLTQFMDRHSDIKEKSVGVMVLIEYKPNVFKC